MRSDKMRRLNSGVIRMVLFIPLFLTANSASTIAPQNITADHPMPTGNELLHDCKQAMRIIDGDSALTDLEFVDASRCTGYILGVVDGYAVTEATEKARIHFSSSLICFPKEGFMPTPEVVRIVVKYLRENPKYLNDPAASSILQAFREAYPCK